MKTSVIGASGAIGKAVVASIDGPVRLVGRDLRKLAGMPAAELVAADVSTDDGCRRAVEGTDTVVYALGVPYTKRAFAAYPGMMRRLLGAAKTAGVQRLVLVTNVYPYGLPRTARVAEDHPRVPASVKGEWRKQQEDVLLTAHEPGGLRTLSLRLPNFYGPGAALSMADGLVRAAIAGKPAYVLGPIDTPQELVFTPDVGPLIAALLRRDDLFGEAYNFAGPGVTTWRAFTEAIFAAAGTAPKIRAMGPRMLRLAGLFSPMLRELGEMAYLQSSPVLLDDGKLRRALPDLHKTPYAEGIRRTVAAYQPKSLPNSWATSRSIGSSTS